MKRMVWLMWLGFPIVVDARQAEIQTQGNGPYYRLSIPSGIYPSALSADLRELHVRNAQGVSVPYAWVQSGGSDSQLHSQAVAIYPLVESREVLLQFQLLPNGSVLALEHNLPQQHDWLLDLSQVQGNLLQARFELQADALGVFNYQIDASDNLRDWHAVAQQESLFRLQHQGSTLEKLSLDLTGHHSKYLRLRAKQLPLKQVQIDSVTEQYHSPALQWSQTLTPSQCQQNSCDYTLPAHTPLDSLRIQLQDNMVAEITVSGINPSQYQHHHHRHPLHLLRHRHTPPPSSNHTWLAQAKVYRITQNQQILQHDDLPLDGGVYQQLRITSQQGQLGQPTIQIGTMPRELIFLAAGQSPYRLKWGEDISQTGVVGLDTLMPNQSVKPDMASVNIVVSNITPKSSVAAVSPPQSNSAIALWAVLVIGLGVLGAMAWSLFKGMKK